MLSCIYFDLLGWILKDEIKIEAVKWV